MLGRRWSRPRRSWGSSSRRAGYFSPLMAILADAAWIAVEPQDADEPQEADEPHDALKPQAADEPQAALDPHTPPEPQAALNWKSESPPAAPQMEPLPHAALDPQTLYGVISMLTTWFNGL